MVKSKFTQTEKSRIILESLNTLYQYSRIV